MCMICVEWVKNPMTLDEVSKALKEVQIDKEHRSDLENIVERMRLDERIPGHAIRPVKVLMDGIDSLVTLDKADLLNPWSKP